MPTLIECFSYTNLLLTYLYLLNNHTFSTPICIVHSGSSTLVYALLRSWTRPSIIELLDKNMRCSHAGPLENANPHRTASRIIFGVQIYAFFLIHDAFSDKVPFNYKETKHLRDGQMVVVSYQIVGPLWL